MKSNDKLLAFVLVEVSDGSRNGSLVPGKVTGFIKDEEPFI